MANVQIAIIDQENTQIALSAPSETQVNIAVPGVQGPVGQGVASGGTTNQVLFKQSSTDYDTAWSEITSDMIGDLEIVDADVSVTAAIAGTKISPDFGSQTVQTTGVVSHALGAAATPTITFTGDTNTGIYSPGADQLAISTGGNGRLFVDATGKVGVGAAPVTYQFEVNGGTANTVAQFTSTDSVARVLFKDNAGEAMIGCVGDDAVVYTSTSANESLRITSTGRVGIGTSSPSSLIHVNSGASDLLAWMQARGANGLESGLLFLTKDSAGTNVGGSIGHDGSTNTLYLTGITSGGTTQHVSITNTGRVGIGTTSPSVNLEVVGQASVGAYIASSGAGTSGYSFSASGSGASAANMFCPSGFTLAFGTNSVERARIDSSGRLLVGTSSASSNGAYSQYGLIQIEGNSSSGAGGAVLTLARGAAAASITDGQDLGVIAFTDNANQEFAYIIGEADGTAGTGDYPGRLVFSTTADGASSPTERMRITQSGAVLCGTTITPTGSSAGTIVAQNKIVVSANGAGRDQHISGATGVITASTGTAIFNFSCTPFSTRAASIRLWVCTSAQTSGNTPSNYAVAQYTFQLHQTTTNVISLNGATTLSEYTFVRATHLAFTDLGNSTCNVTLTNPTTVAQTFGYRVEILDSNGTWQLASVSVT